MTDLRLYEKVPAPNVVIVEVIAVEFTIGAGTEADPARIATGYYDRDGTLLAVRDDFEPSKEGKGR